MKVEELRVLKVEFHDEFYVLIVPNGEYRDFYLCHNVIGSPDHMFTCNVDSDEMAVTLAANNVEAYIDKWEFELEEEE